MIKDPIILVFSGVLFFESGLETLTNNWTTTYMQKGMNLPAAAALATLTAHIAALTVMRLSLRGLLERYSSYSMLQVGLVFVLLGIICLMVGNSFLLAIIGLSLLGIGYAGVFPIVMGRVGELWPKLSGTAFSIVLIISLFGNILTNYLMGLASQYFGVKVLPFGLMICLCLLIVLLLKSGSKFSLST